MTLGMWFVDQEIWLWYYYGPKEDWILLFPKFDILPIYGLVILQLQGLGVVNIMG